MRGDHYTAEMAEEGHPGTSPHARGPRIVLRCGDYAVGNIPACAGTTSESFDYGVEGWEHPRMRGDHR